MPIVVNISLSTNDGAHNGTSLLEQYISAIANLERVTIVIAAGNEEMQDIMLAVNFKRFKVDHLL